jgi:hypothetical protein
MNRQDAKNAKGSFYYLFSSRPWRLGGEKLAPADFATAWNSCGRRKFAAQPVSHREASHYYVLFAPTQYRKGRTILKSE